MLFRVEVGPREGMRDSLGMKMAARINELPGMDSVECRMIKVFTVSGLYLEQVRRLLAEGIWHDPISQRASIGSLSCLDPLPQWLCEVGFRPGVTDNEGRTARDAAALALDVPRETLAVYTASQYRLGRLPAPLTEDDSALICRDLLCNELIQRFRVKSYEQWRADDGFEPLPAAARGASSPIVASIDLSALDDEGLEHLSRANTWALTLGEMRAIRDYFQNNKSLREARGLSANPTDVEIEALAQTWSEHCKHKIFSSRIKYANLDTGRKKIVDNLYKTCIRDTTAILRERAGSNDYCHSVFRDNAGVIAFINGYDACIKVETHNSPSALDPYGGALTGIVGVNRDPMGTGMGADLICNMDVFCFAPPSHKGPLPPRILHPRRVLEGVRQGVEDGGNKSGIPTVNGSIVFDPRYLGKPLVFCGTVGLLPATVCGHPGYEKSAEIGDIIVMVGGRIGKDGIHGATFSSEELHAGSPATAVQIGDPITQRKMYDFILRARDACLYHSITDNGAGGLSSSVGEMAEDTGGCVLELDKAPLKYEGLAPWEILLSEAQERMTIAVPPENLDAFLELASRMDVEATPLGHFNNSGYFEVRYKGEIAALINMEFLHHGAPRLNLEAEWRTPQWADVRMDAPAGSDCAWHNDFLEAMLGRLNICSREGIIRQYDHEVRGGSAVKPLVGVLRDGPSDGAVLRPLMESDAGLVLAHGICPKYSDYDTYWMMANAIDEAIRNAVSVGANPDSLAGIDNFCWCDPVESPKNPDGRYKLAQLVRACQALRQFSLAYGVPCISGKDSMKNDYLGNNGRISIPPTVLFTVLGAIDNVIHAQTSDFKQPGDAIYMLGGTWREMGASEASAQLGIEGGKIPRVNAASALARYRALHALIDQRAISACHDCSDGGLAVALAEMCIGGRLGCAVNLDALPVFGDLSSFEALYSESASRHLVSVRPELASILEALGLWQICVRIGEVTEKPIMEITSGDTPIIQSQVEKLAAAFKDSQPWQ